MNGIYTDELKFETNSTQTKDDDDDELPSTMSHQPDTESSAELNIVDADLYEVEELTMAVIEDEDGQRVEGRQLGR